MEIELVRIGNKLVATDSYQNEELMKIPANKPFILNYKQSRHSGNHRRLFAFINTAFDMQEHYQTREALRFALIIKAGYVDKIVSHRNGSIVLMPHSLKFAEMGEEKFKTVFKDIITAFHAMLQEMGNRISEDELLRLIEFD